MKETQFGVVIANVLSVATRGVGLFLWYFLRLIYRGEPKVIAGFVGVGLAIVLLIWLIVR
ncbi:hypothetical protein [Sphingomonas psychrotolerans]|uniref:Uncharacterized protein n=1 Tax=Sphingomonas psychrotolerans TaxID=1327635 RepID=A0A2K8MD25_9SPHN|nr:hypothetical protein [Sphingomonas psychrotolerans]ATY31795.1 hypothetical protein CVN68_07285 [Sphingomonas psychrotolerans]